MQHNAICPVSLGLESMFGTKCSCGHVHPSIMCGNAAQIDTSFRWIQSGVTFARIEYSLPLTIPKELFVRPKWGMATF